MTQATHDTYPTTIEHSVMEQAAAELETKMEAYVVDPDMHELIISAAQARGIDLESDDFEDEAAFMAAAQRALDFRNGEGRNAIKATELDTRTLTALDAVVDKQNMKRNTEPAVKEVAVGFVPGAAGIIPEKRLDYLVELIEAGKVETNIIALIGSERKIDMKPNAKGLTELDRAGAAGFNKAGEPAETEFDLLRNTAARKFDIEDEAWSLLTGRDPRVPSGEGFQQDWRIAYAVTADDKHVFVTSAAMISENRYRPNGKSRTQSNTTDGYRMVAEMLQDTEPDAPRRVLAVTDAISAPFQGVDATAALAPYEFATETVGYSREHAGLPDWPAGPAYYLQEVLSTLRRTRAARDYLAKDAHPQSA